MLLAGRAAIAARLPCLRRLLDRIGHRPSRGAYAKAVMIATFSPRCAFPPTSDPLAGAEPRKARKMRRLQGGTGELAWSRLSWHGGVAVRRVLEGLCSRAHGSTVSTTKGEGTPVSRRLVDGSCWSWQEVLDA